MVRRSTSPCCRLLTVWQGSQVCSCAGSDRSRGPIGVAPNLVLGVVGVKEGLR